MLAPSSSKHWFRHRASLFSAVVFALLAIGSGSDSNDLLPATFYYIDDRVVDTLTLSLTGNKTKESIEITGGKIRIVRSFKRSSEVEEEEGTCKLVKSEGHITHMTAETKMLFGGVTIPSRYALEINERTETVLLTDPDTGYSRLFEWEKKK